MVNIKKDTFHFLQGVKAEREKTLKLIKMIRASPKPMADELSCLEKELKEEPKKEAKQK
jgi:hypothetical protein